MIFKQIVIDNNANCYIVRGAGSRESIVVDPGSRPEDIAFEIDKRSLEVRYIVLTHGHPDHTGACRAIKERTGAEVVIHREDAFLLASHGGPLPDRLIDEGDLLRCGPLAFEVMHTPGHTPGGLCLLGEGWVFTGDTLFAEGIGATHFPYASEAQLRASIARILALPGGTTVFPGHGFVSSVDEIRKDNRYI